MGFVHCVHPTRASETLREKRASPFILVHGITGFTFTASFVTEDTSPALCPVPRPARGHPEL